MVNSEYHQRCNCILKDLISHISEHPSRSSIKDLVILLVQFGDFWGVGLFVWQALWRIFWLLFCLFVLFFVFPLHADPGRKAVAKRTFPKMEQ